MFSHKHAHQTCKQYRIAHYVAGYNKGNVLRSDLVKWIYAVIMVFK